MAEGDELDPEYFAKRKKPLFSTVQGAVLEIGPGTGINFSHIRKQIRWVGIEPNVAMHSYIRTKARKQNRKIKIISGNSENIPFPDASFDSVLSTHVLCSVKDLRLTLTEVRRVLKKKGKFYFMEHVADKVGTIRWFIQKILPYTPWRFFSDGCDPGREIGRKIKEAGFKKSTVRHYMQKGEGLLMNIARPHIYGTASK